MKRFLTIILALAMVLSLCACSSSETPPETTEEAPVQEDLLIGFGRANITPDFSVGIGGYSDYETRRSEGHLDNLYITCIAATQGEETILLFNADNLAMSAAYLKKVREAVSPATSIPADHIVAYATHTHSAPSLTTGDAEGKQYLQLFLDRAVKAAQVALEDRSPSKIFTATAELVNKNAVRHYKMDDGTYAGSNFGDFSKTIVGHATEGDSRMVLIKFDRIDKYKQDIVLANWQAHADHAKANGYRMLSADHPGSMRTKFESQTGMLFTYITGASGNQNPDSKIESEKHGLGMVDYGQMLADEALKMLPELKEVSNNGVAISTEIYKAEIDHSWDHMLEQANEVYNLWKSEGKSKGDALGKTYGFTSSYQARAIRTRAKKGESENFELHAFRIGDIGFISSHCEMFSACGLYVREHSPFETTFICTGNSGYIPDEAAYDYRSYEADTGMYAKGTCENMAKTFVEMLKGLK